MGINKVVGMCTSNSYHNMISFLVTTTITNNTIAIINEILFRLLMLLSLTQWDIAHFIALTTLLDLFQSSHTSK
jgi:hypothetical protein